MGLNPTQKAVWKWEGLASSDFLQVLGPNNSPLGWIDSKGSPQGSLSSTIPFLGAPTGSCSPQQTAVNSLTGDFYSCQNGTWTLVGPTAGSLVSPVVSPNPLAFDVNVNFKGPNPYRDVTRYGVRAVNEAVAPAIPGITVTINAGSASASLSAASTFVKGDGVTIFGAGTAHTLTTPVGLTVTPSIAAAGTATGIVVAGPSGSTTYNYQIIARNKAGGLTAAGSVASTGTGAASLGSQSVTISTLTRSGLVVTITTSSAHGLSVGSMVYVSNTSDNANFGGWYVVSTVADNTHFTYSTGLLDTNGASTSATGGTARWFNCNHLSWTAVTGAFEYYIYGRTGVSLTLIGVSQPTGGSGVVTTSWDDFGSPMMDGITLPYFVPTTPPISSLNNPLVTTILSGAGTTSLTLANSASNSVVSSTILFDNAPTIAMAAASGGLLYFPVGGGSYVVNSYLTLPGQTSISQAGVLVLNDTVEVPSDVLWIGTLGTQHRSAMQFGWEAGNYIFVSRANPGMYSQGGGIFKGVQFNVSTNGTAQIIDNANQSKWSNVNYQNSGYVGISLILRDSGGGVFFNQFDNLAFLQGPGQINGACYTPALYIDGDGTFHNFSLSNCGIFMKSTSTGTAVDILVTGMSRMQGGIMPFFTFHKSGGGDQGGSFQFSNIELDTMAHAMFANLLNTNTDSLSAGVSFIQGTGPSNGFGWITGGAVGAVVNGLGQNTNWILGSYFSDKAIQVFGAGTIGYKMATPGAPASAVVSAGGGVPIGVHTYALAAIDANGNFTPVGPTLSATTTSGNQTVTISAPASPPPGTTGYTVLRDGLFLANSGGTCGNFVTIASANGTFVDALGSTCNNGLPSPRALSSSISSSGIETPILRLISTLFANLGTPINGTFVYCPDCTVANPCAGSGTGALAKRLNSAWVCN